MSYPKLYEVTLRTKHGKHPDESFRICVEAYNQKNAKHKAERLWYGAYEAHAFNMKARQIEYVEGPNRGCFWFERIPNNYSDMINVLMRSSFPTDEKIDLAERVLKVRKGTGAYDLNWFVEMCHTIERNRSYV